MSASNGFAMPMPPHIGGRHDKSDLYPELANCWPGCRKPAFPGAIATSGRMETAAVNLAALGVDPDRNPVVTRDEVKYAKPDPDLFVAAAERLNAPIETAVVVGDSIWDMLAAIRCRALGVGLLSGGYGPDELRQSADLLRRIDEVGGRR
jgi:phosphoglycolate phosphatase-like HAD superfamily hydrolase